jgi:hypothetical protein
MAERVPTGGIKQFAYNSSQTSKLSNEEKQGIREAYARADERKRREKERKNTITVVIILIVLAAIAAYFILK